MAFFSQNKFIRELQAQDELIVIDCPVSTNLEITEIADRIMKSVNYNKALLFLNNGTEFPLLINSLGTEKRVSIALNIPSLDKLQENVEKITSLVTSKQDGFWRKLKLLPQLLQMGKWMPQKKRGRGECQQIVMKHPNLNKLPILKCWPHDGGFFFTLPCVHTVNPLNGSSNVGMYRMQVFGKDIVGMHWHKHKTGARHFDIYKKQNKTMPIAVTLGGDIAYTYAAIAPMPEDMSEHVLSGFLRNKPVKLVKCLTNNLWVPSDVDFVIEGYVDTTEDLVLEGPFGDHTGFYSLTDFYPLMHVTAITHREGAIFPATIVGVPPMEDAVIAKATEKLFLPPIKMVIAPEVVDMHLPMWGVAHNLAIISIKTQYEGQAYKVAQSVWGAGQMMFTKVIILVNETVDVRKYSQVITEISQKLQYASQLFFSKGVADVLDHAVEKNGVGSKICIDLTLDLSINEGVVNKHIDFYYAEYGEKLDFNTVTLSNSAFDFGIVLENSLKKLSIEQKLWYTLNNIDPERDILVQEKAEKLKIIVDGRTKTGNSRWPNIVTMDAGTICKVDDKWHKLFYFPLIQSPSKELLHLTKGDKAALYENF